MSGPEMYAEWELDAYVALAAALGRWFGARRPTTTPILDAVAAGLMMLLIAFVARRIKYLLARRRSASSLVDEAGQ